jgi:DeoR/GlpR family transcriptional regulator of sugar metabolism
MPEPLFVEERRRIILQRLKQAGRVSVNELSEAMQVSAVTIRQDLRALEERHLLERTYGGAVVRSAPYPLRELAFDIRKKQNRRAKEAIGAAAAAMVRNEDAIALDGSTTAFALVPHLKKLDIITIVTNSLIIAQSFLDCPDFRVLMPGGRLRPDSISLVGQPENLPDINLNIGFFGAHGISMEGGISEIDLDEATMKKAMIAHCVRTVIIADGTKWGQIAPYPFVNVVDVERILTTWEAPEALVASYRELNVPVDVLSV